MPSWTSVRILVQTDSLKAASLCVSDKWWSWRFEGRCGSTFAAPAISMASATISDHFWSTSLRFLMQFSRLATSTSSVASLHWIALLHASIGRRTFSQKHAMRMHSKDWMYLIAPWTSDFTFGVNLRGRHCSRQEDNWAMLFLNGRTARILADHLVGVSWRKEWSMIDVRISQRLGLERKKLKTHCTIPKNVIASLQQSAASLPHKLSEWQPQGE